MFAAGMMMGGRPVYTVNISSSGGTWKRTVDAPSIPSGIPITLNLTVTAGIERQATSTSAAAIDIDGIASGSIVNFTNLGYGIGCGGRGGTSGLAGGNGLTGGPAVKGPGAGVEFNVTNAAGRFWGGGGGGGGGGTHRFYVPSDFAYDWSDSGGSGGGGAGGGAAGTPSSTGAGTTGNSGTAGTTGSAGVHGTGGSANQASAGAGADGGDYGAAGSAGTSGKYTGGPNNLTNVNNQGSGGPAGKAIDLNGGTITWISGSSSPNVKGAVA